MATDEPGSTPAARPPSEVTPPPARARWALLVGVAVAVVVLDQLTKWWAVDELTSGPVDLFLSLQFRLAFNSGASFSLGGGQGRLIGLVVVVVAGAVLWSGRHATTKLGAISRGLIVGGAIGNLIDRVFRADDGVLSGKVVDFIDPGFFPVFNIADSGVVIGCGLLILSTLLEPDSNTSD